MVIVHVVPQSKLAGRSSSRRMAPQATASSADALAGALANRAT